MTCIPPTTPERGDLQWNYRPAKYQINTGFHEITLLIVDTFSGYGKVDTSSPMVVMHPFPQQHQSKETFNGITGQQNADRKVRTLSYLLKAM
ncbi:hypothetical protein Glove_273g27 [Diversispora epigaea]|uniref:Uncharacterized protein n=1 Tax=Diversispora epigaea TaxID=1348612 RepID=A0A397I536_9GLOM|nr:hypothetical protein Glove_273g27 [Diversispora epigaea]